jgi:tetratricopeptide (TPR) repeat protein
MALDEHRRAAQLDPSFALAWAGIAGVRSAQAFFGFATASEALPEARAAARRALALDARLGEAYGTLGYIALYWDRDFEGARVALEKAVALSPHATMTRHSYADYLLAAGDVEASLAQVRTALANDPVSWPARGVYLYHAFMARRYDEVAGQVRDIMKGGPATPTLRDYLARALWMQGQHGEALAEWRMAFGLGPALDQAHAKGGARQAMLALAAWAAARVSEDPQSGAERTASFYAAAGDADRAFPWLERSFSRQEPFILHVAADPFFDAVRSDPRMTDLLGRIGRAPGRR